MTNAAGGRAAGPAGPALPASGMHDDHEDEEQTMRWFGLLGLCVLMAGCGGESPATAADAAHPGQQTYTRFCFSCHAAGIADAPRVGDAEDWAPRIAKGPDALLAATIEGIPPGMPPRGLCAQCSDEELAQAIDYMVERSRPGS
jgi:cytochrome c5